MNIAKYSMYILPGLLLSACISGSGMVQASDDTATNTAFKPPAKSGKVYLPSNDPMADLTAAFDAARKSERLLLVVMGANWCHDSRALASRLYQEPLSTVIDANFEPLFVDVGYLDKGNEVINSLGIPVYYATPTVLIVEPVSGHVINLQNRHQWAEAATISMQDSVDYFRHFADNAPGSRQNDEDIDEDLRLLLTDIEAFEQVQAERLYAAYAILSPMLHAYKQGDKDAFSQSTWDEVRDYRYKVSRDVENLRAEANERVSAGETGIQLDFPVYPAFSWDQD